MSVTSLKPRILSELLQDAVEELQGEEITLRQIADQLGTRAYGVFIVLLTIPNFIPGISILSGILLMIFSIQMALGIEKPWLPQFISNFAIRRTTLVKAMGIMAPLLRRFEHYIKPRLAIFSHETALRLLGWAIAFFALITLFPVPFSNFIPSLVLLFMAFGMLQKDGLTVTLSVTVGVIYAVGFFYILSSLITKIISF